MSDHTFFMISLLSPGLFLLAIAYGIYAEARRCLMSVRLMWQRHQINRHLAQHGIANDQVLDVLMQLESFSCEFGGQICTFRRGAEGVFAIETRKEGASHERPEVAAPQ
jgi:hypothetical protein